MLDAAFESETAIPDLFVAAGRLAASEGDFGQANEFYDASALQFGLGGIEPHLLREVPANLIWRTARQVAKTDKAAGLDLLNRALRAGIEGEAGAYPERRAQRRKAQLLQDLGRSARMLRPPTAKQPKDTCGPPPERAERLYQKAYELSPEDPRCLWGYGEMLRSRGIDADGIVDVTATTEAKSLFEKGFAHAIPGREDAWVLTSAGLAADALNDDVDATVLVERGMLLDPGHARAYAFLAMLLRTKGFLTEAVLSAEQGYSITKDDVLVTQQYALALGEVGKYQEAIKVVRHNPESALIKSMFTCDWGYYGCAHGG